MTPSCTNWTPIEGINHGGRCALRNASVSFGVCVNACAEQDGEWREKLKQKLSGQIAARETAPSMTAKSLPEPSLMQMGVEFVAAITAWGAAGFPVAQNDELERRRALCKGCANWQPEARAGLGKCKLCGCCCVKWWLATSKCPAKPPLW